jgi:hypothetical protein
MLEVALILRRKILIFLKYNEKPFILEGLNPSSISGHLDNESDNLLSESKI